MIADDNKDLCEILKEYFEFYPDLKCVGVAYDGFTALEMVSALEPDILILDLAMPNLDGLGVLERMPKTLKTKVILGTANGRDFVHEGALERGAEMVILKPFLLDGSNGDLISRIRMINGCGQPKAPHTNTVCSFLLSLGFKPNHLGYRYIEMALEIMLREWVDDLFKVIYIQIASKYETSPQNIDAAIRSAVLTAYASDNANFSNIFGDAKPSNSTFLSTAREYLKEDLKIDIKK